jgi:hypothetical protein
MSMVLDILNPFYRRDLHWGIYSECLTLYSLLTVILVLLGVYIIARAIGTYE